MLIYLHKYLQQTGCRGLLESHNLALAHSGEFGGGRVDQTRDWIDKAFKIKFPSGRKPAPPDEPGKQAALRLFNELTKILIPGFDKANKSVPKIRAAFDAVALAGLPDPDSRIADQLWGKRSPKQAAICLTAQKLNRSERQVRRWVSE